MNTCLQKTEQQQKIQRIQDSLRDILLFFVGFFCLVFVALIILNMASAIDVDADLGLFFGFQTTTIDEYQENNIQPSINDLELGKSSHIQSNTQPRINLDVKMGIDNIVPIAQGTQVNDLDTVPGSITIERVAYGTDYPLALCMDDAAVDEWYLSVSVVGGYTPERTYVSVWQASAEDKNVDIKKGCIQVDWTAINPQAPCCEAKLYDARFSIRQPFCLDSNQYPAIIDNTGYGVNVGMYAPFNEIPDKGVDLCFSSVWAGCSLDDQEFVLISVREKYQFPNN